MGVCPQCGFSSLMLRPGDALLYSYNRSLVSWLIRVKTWSIVSHIEIYIGEGKVIAARGKGSQVYNFDRKNLKEVWRPKTGFDIEKAKRWFYVVANGQCYDWLGLFRFFIIGKQTKDKQFCSELATRFYRNGDFEPFNPLIDADLISPSMFRASARMERIWPS